MQITKMPVDTILTTVARFKQVFSSLKYTIQLIMKQKKLTVSTTSNRAAIVQEVQDEYFSDEVEEYRLFLDMLRHSSRITRFGLHVAACRCDRDFTWISLTSITLL